MFINIILLLESVDVIRLYNSKFLRYIKNIFLEKEKH